MTSFLVFALKMVVAGACSLTCKPLLYYIKFHRALAASSSGIRTVHWHFCLGLRTTRLSRAFREELRVRDLEAQALNPET